MNRTPSTYKSTCFVTIDKLLYREALLYHLMNQEQIEILGEASTGFDTLNQLAHRKANTLIIEEDLKDNDGLTISEMALELQPSLSILLLVDVEISQKRLAIYLESGIKTVVSKTQPVKELFKALRYMQEGKAYINPQLFQQSRPAETMDETIFHSLSAREQEVAQLMADRMTAQEIAERLGLSHKTIHSYKDRILVKMGFEKLPELILYMKRFRNKLPK